MRGKATVEMERHKPTRNSFLRSRISLNSENASVHRSPHHLYFISVSQKLLPRNPVKHKSDEERVLESLKDGQESRPESTGAGTKG